MAGAPCISCDPYFANIGVGEIPVNFSHWLTYAVEGDMNEAGMLKLLGAIRDDARAKAMFRLAEHIDDAMLLAASEFHDQHDRLIEERNAFDVGSLAGDIRNAARPAFH